MRIRELSWQRQGDYWQPLFIRENFLAIAAVAYAGFLQHGRGMVTCDVELPTHAPVDWSRDLLDHQICFQPLPYALELLSQLEVDEETCITLSAALADYEPEQEIMLWLRGNGDVQVMQLKNLAIAPVEAYTQLRQRWDEFQIGVSFERRVP
ncbi:hypothetical protein [Leptolyngbya sp. FACHB-16]|uniref:hypothetical protein n=1 Tax=unclassified Leptolyngbya TaxID=2650499 RepID=UPI001684F55C|nr:hypothetical protein [Leptolyngbya sp. FACHB-16]MBD2157689.1 hypothetical protein [Leptolyngbya sp. FACHB-16]